ncbi:hypothetical protein [Streptomyces sp. NBC_01334]|uniref:hypothetical protein n=1 Tax=Streptomyces sp. NBC_01334 TaxID=2903827 RepID=UPI002E136463|nr:hypothetical protein OG736_03635 [Streptomyces sp. NBC_01334]
MCTGTGTGTATVTVTATVTGANRLAMLGIKDVVTRENASGRKGREHVLGPALRKANRPGRDGGRLSRAGVHTDVTVDSQETLAFTTPLPVDTFFTKSRHFGGS